MQQHSPRRLSSPIHPEPLPLPTPQSHSHRPLNEAMVITHRFIEINDPGTVQGFFSILQTRAASAHPTSIRWKRQEPSASSDYHPSMREQAGGYCSERTLPRFC
jgi:hypothetical protein